MVPFGRVADGEMSGSGSALIRFICGVCWFKRPPVPEPHTSTDTLTPGIPPPIGLSQEC